MISGRRELINEGHSHGEPTRRAPEIAIELEEVEAAAFEVTVMVEGSDLALGDLTPGSQKSGELALLPQRSGDVLLELWIAHRDSWVRGEYQSQWITVKSSRSNPTVYVQGNYHQGDYHDVRVQQGNDSIAMVKGVGPQWPIDPTATPGSGRFCPYCGQILDLPKPPRFCPFCRAELET